MMHFMHIRRNKNIRQQTVNLDRSPNVGMGDLCEDDRQRLVDHHNANGKAGDQHSEHRKNRTKQAFTRMVP